MCLLAVWVAGCHRELDRQVEREIGVRVASKQAPPFVRGVRWSLVQQVYRDREHRPIWLSGSRPAGRARELVRAICRSGEEGLRPADYDLAGLRTALQRLAPQLRVRRNYPYAGKGDGLTRELRSRYSARTYIGIELEINQKHVRAAGRGFRVLRRAIVESLRAALAQR